MKYRLIEEEKKELPYNHAVRTATVVTEFESPDDTAAGKAALSLGMTPKGKLFLLSGPADSTLRIYPGEKPVEYPPWEGCISDFDET